MVNSKDRGPVCAGSRPFHSIKYIAIILLLALIGLCYYGSRLVIAVLPEQNKTPYAFTTEVGDTWKISLTHSVEKTPWHEYFRVDGLNNMTMTHTIFQSLGWGYPYSADDGKLTQLTDGRYLVVMNRPFSSVPLRISVQAMQHFHHGVTDLDLCKIYGQGTKMDIKVMYRYQYWLQRLQLYTL